MVRSPTERDFPRVVIDVLVFELGGEFRGEVVHLYDGRTNAATRVISTSLHEHLPVWRSLHSVQESIRQVGKGH